jgi:ketosteroid isomerase-like protein
MGGPPLPAPSVRIAFMTPDDLVEIEQIRQLKARYFHLLDRKQWDAWEQVFCDDVRVDTSHEGSPLLHGRKAFREFLEPILASVLTVHHGHASEITLSGPDTASGVWSMEDHLWWPAEQGGRHLWGTGFYFEQYRKGADGSWRIRELILRRTRTEVDGRQTFPLPNPQEEPPLSNVIETWHRIVRARDFGALDHLLDEDAVFHSPIVHSPQRGKALTKLYLQAAFGVFAGERTNAEGKSAPSPFRYVREVVGKQDAALEFETEMDGIHVNGVDLIRWNDAGRIVDFKVMIRPLKAVNQVHATMKRMLEAMAPAGARKE